MIFKVCDNTGDLLIPLGYFSLCRGTSVGATAIYDALRREKFFLSETGAYLAEYPVKSFSGLPQYEFLYLAEMGWKNKFRIAQLTK